MALYAALYIILRYRIVLNKLFACSQLELTTWGASRAGTIFGQGRGKTGNAKLMGSLSNLDRVFVPEISV